MRHLALGLLFVVGAAIPASSHLVGIIGDRLPIGTPAYTGSGDEVSGASFYGGVFAYTSATRGTAALQLCNVGDAACTDVNSDAATGIVPNAPVIGAITCGTGANLCTVKIIYDKTGVIGDLTQAEALSRVEFKPSCVGSVPCLKYRTGFASAFYTGGTFNQASYTFSYGGAFLTAGGGTVISSAATSVYFYSTSVDHMKGGGGEAIGATTLTGDQFYAHTGTVNSGSGAVAVYVNGTSDGTNTGATTAASGAIGLYGLTTNSSTFYGYAMEFRIDPVVLSGGGITSLSANMRSRGGY